MRVRLRRRAAPLAALAPGGAAPSTAGQPIGGLLLTLLKAS